MLKKYLFILIFLSIITSLYSDSRERFALVIGNANYEGIAKLKNPVNDAKDISNELDKIGWDVTLVTDASRRAMLKSITGFRDKISGKVTPIVMVYYAGHGMQIEGENYLLPIGSIFETIDDVEADGIKLNYVTGILEKSEPDMTLVVLDACRDNPFGSTGTRSAGQSRGLSVVQVPGGEIGSAVIFATSPGDVALDGAGSNGVFTKAFLNNIASSERLEDVFRKITQEVRTISNDGQIPWINASLSDDFYLISDEIRLQRLKVEQDNLEKLKAEEIAKATESVRIEIVNANVKAEKALAEKHRLEIEAEKAKELSQAEKDKIEVELAAAKEASSNALIALEEAKRKSNEPKGKIRIESGLEGEIFINGEFIGFVSQNKPLISDNLTPGNTKFIFKGKNGASEDKEVIVTDTAYSTIIFQEDFYINVNKKIDNEDGKLFTLVTSLGISGFQSAVQGQQGMGPDTYIQLVPILSINEFKNGIGLKTGIGLTGNELIESILQLSIGLNYYWFNVYNNFSIFSGISYVNLSKSNYDTLHLFGVQVGVSSGKLSFEATIAPVLNRDSGISEDMNYWLSLILGWRF